MKVLEKKRELISRDPLWMEFERKFREWRASRNINLWGEGRKENSWVESYQSLLHLALQLEGKWVVSIYNNGYLFTGLPAFFIGGPMKDSLEIEGREPISVEIGRWANYSGFYDLVECPTGKIPIIIDPSVLTLNDARKIKKAVWNIVEKKIKTQQEYNKAQAKHLSTSPIKEPPEDCREDRFVFADDSINNDLDELEKHRSYFQKEGRKQQIATLNGPRIPSREPQELAKIFHTQTKTFEQYLRWYDLHKAGLPFRLIALVEYGSCSLEEKQEKARQLINRKKKPKIGKPARGENAVRNGYNLIHSAIERDPPPSDEKLIQIIGHYDCPEHDGNNCPEHCAYLKDFMNKFDATSPTNPQGDLIGKNKDFRESALLVDDDKD